MSIRSLMDYWTKWSGGARTLGAAPSGSSDPQVSWRSMPVLPEPIKHLASQASLPDEVVAVLNRYRAALQALAPASKGCDPGQVLADAQAELMNIPLLPSLGATTRLLIELFSGTTDIIFRGILIGGRRPSLLLYVDGLVDAKRLELSIMDPLTRWGDPDQFPTSGGGLRTWAESVATAAGQTNLVRSVGEAVEAVLSGNAVLLVDGAESGVLFGIPGWKERAIEEPISEPVIRGPREGFTETLRTNTALLRSRLRTPDLKLEQITLGRASHTPVVLAYLASVASPNLVVEVKSRLERIDIDGFTDPTILEEYIEDQPSSAFPQVNSTERPDTTAYGLLEGQVAILCEGSPFAILAPVTFWSFLQSSEDYYERFYLATLLRYLRYLFLALGLIGPSLYIAIVTYHQEMLPTALLLTIAAAREGIPFPALVEAFTMEVFFEAFREAGVRLPRPVGQAVSIVGALVIGQSAVQAGIISAPIVIVVAATGIGSFTIPRYSFTAPIRVLRFPLMILAGSLGLFGLMAGLIAILIHLCALRSFGVPYLQPIAPLIRGGLGDVLVRPPLWMKGFRPIGLGQTNRRRQDPWLKPGPGGDGR